MKRLGLFAFPAVITFYALALFDPAQAQAHAAPGPAQSQSAVSAPGTMVVYVSDFDLDVVPRKPAPKPPATRTSPRPKPPSTSRAPSGVPRKGPSPVSEQTPLPSTDTAETEEASKEETPAQQANALVKAVSENLIRALTKAGFDARHLAANDPPPTAGVRVRGVFAEADETNRARRLLVGGEPVGPNIILYVGVNNLKNPDQPLYLLADPPAKDPRHGPVITVTSYSPAARYELSRDPSGEELEKLATRVAADLSTLVSTNRLSLTQ